MRWEWHWKYVFTWSLSNQVHTFYLPKAETCCVKQQQPWVSGLCNSSAVRVQSTGRHCGSTPLWLESRPLHERQNHQQLQSRFWRQSPDSRVCRHLNCKLDIELNWNRSHVPACHYTRKIRKTHTQARKCYWFLHNHFRFFKTATHFLFENEEVQHFGEEWLIFITVIRVIIAAIRFSLAHCKPL